MVYAGDLNPEPRGRRFTDSRIVFTTLDVLAPAPLGLQSPLSDIESGQSDRSEDIFYLRRTQLAQSLATASH